MARGLSLDRRVFNLEGAILPAVVDVESSAAAASTEKSEQTAPRKMNV